LISTIPLNRLIQLAPGVVDSGVADRLRFSSTTVVGVGPVKLPNTKTKCWTGFSEPNSSHYRVTVFSNYSLNNVPRPAAGS
jgi:protoporphyrinogen oxidase